MVLLVQAGVMVYNPIVRGVEDMREPAIPVEPEINDRISYSLNVNSFEIQANFYRKDIEGLFLPLLKTLTYMQKAKGERLIVFLAAPPGAGKTTLSIFLAHLSRITAGLMPIQPAGLDGFHYHQDYIESHTVISNGKPIPMKSVKGCPETFDLNKTGEKLRQLREHDVKWPVYDRTLHDVVEDAAFITGSIVIVEGNWLLLDEPGWRDLKSLCDYSVFVHADEAMLEERLIGRKIKGGSGPEDARGFYLRSDQPNVYRALEKRLDSDMILYLREDGSYRNSRN